MSIAAASVHPPSTGPRLGFRGKLGVLARDIKLSHTVFAMPFALLAAFLAANGWPGTARLLLVIACMVTARTVAMTANRLLDAQIDRRNPRTAGRAIPSGRVSRSFVLTALLICAAAFWLSAAGFWFFYHNALPALLAPVVIVYVCAYPLMKRFTRLCHYYLGAALALAPVCAWVAIAGTVGRPAWLMAAVVVCWTAGFDILYACQDYAIDVAEGLSSMPSRLGISGALWVARLTHAVSAAMLVLLAVLTPTLHGIFPFAVAAAVALLVIEHTIVRGGDLSKLNVAFFTINGIISLTLGAAGIVDVLTRG
jgi:4-hydroxybenzoate polyprenyltransferase